MQLSPASIIDDLEVIQHADPALWNSLRGRRLFLTGGTGFFGIWILETIRHLNASRQLNISVTVLSRSPEGFLKRYPYFISENWLSFISGDICSFPFHNIEVDDIIHAATPVTETLNPVDLWDTIVQGTRHALDFAVVAKAKRFLLTSSGAVYGGNIGSAAPFDETLATTPPSTLPSSGYGLGKRAAEWMCTAYADKTQLECKIARCFAFAGPFQPLDNKSALGSFIADALQGSAIHIKGDGKSVRSYLYVTDLVFWLFKVLVSGRPSEPYNIGSEEGVTMLELANMVRRTVGCKKEVIVAHSLCAARGADRYVPSTAKIRRELGGPVPVALSAALHKTISWHRANLSRTASPDSGFACAQSSHLSSELNR